jgi:GntR family transcriptional regulator/MocR family aminotransferase
MAMAVHITLGARGLAADVYTQLRTAILDGRLRTGEALPATRSLARELGVSRNTVLHAYQRLIAEGFLDGKVGAGTFVCAPARLTRRAPSGALAPRAVWRSLIAPAPSPTPVSHDFSLGSPDPALFPWDDWRRLVARELRGRRRTAGYPPPDGDPGLRAAIARHIGLSRAVRAGADDVLVSHGAQQALDLIARVLIEPGATVAVEEPGYPPAREAFTAHGARVVPVRVDAEGIVVERIPIHTKLVYVTPSHQFPLGTAMSLARRLALLAWAERHGAAIVEDDYDSELRFDGRPLEPLQSLDRAGRVLYVGTFSKVLLPTLRLGFVVAPPSLMPALHAAKRLADSHGALEPQRALRAFLDDGLFARHLRRVLRDYRERHAVLTAALAAQLADRLTPLPAAAGLHVAAWLTDRRADDTAIAAAARAAGVAVEPLSAYFARTARPGLALGFGLVRARHIDAGIRALAGALGQA